MENDTLLIKGEEFEDTKKVIRIRKSKKDRQHNSDNLEKLQMEAGWIVTGLPLFASRQSIYSETGWELLSDRQRVRRLSLFYSIHKKSAPDYLCDLKPLLVGSVSQYNFQKVIIMFYLIVEYKLPQSPSSPLLPGIGTI